MPRDQVQHQLWFQFIAELDELLANPDCGWAEQSLTGIRDTVLATRRVTEAQRHALQAIRTTASCWGV